MKQKRKTETLILFFAFLFGIIALDNCSTPKMAVAPELASRASPMPIQRNGVMLTSDATIGNYTTHITKDTRGGGAKVGFETSKANVNIEYHPEWELFYEVSHPSRPKWITECKETTYMDIECKIYPEDGSCQQWIMNLQMPRTQPEPGRKPEFSGIITTGQGMRLTIVQERASSGPVHLLLHGYHIFDNSVPVGAVEIIYDGKIWVPSDIDQCSQSSIFSALYGIYVLSDTLTVRASE